MRAAAELAGVQRQHCGVGMRLRVYVQDLRRRDLDNIEKACTDALNPRPGSSFAAWEDDSQLCLVLKSKHLDRERPRVELDLWPVPESPFVAPPKPPPAAKRPGGPELPKHLEELQSKPRTIVRLSPEEWERRNGGR